MNYKNRIFLSSTFSLWLIVFLALTPVANAGSGCLQFLTDYYNCMNGNLTTSNRNDPNATRLDDSFYQRELALTTTFASAMQLFRRLYNELKSCDTDKCKCVKTESYLRYDYEALFTNTLTYPQVYSILNTIKTNYLILPQSEIFNYNQLFNPNYPSLNTFCFYFEYGDSISFFYNQTFQCYARYLSNPKYFQDCRSSYLTLDIYNRDQSLDMFSRGQLEEYFGCVGTLFQGCEADVRRLVIMGFLSESTNAFADSNLITYIDYLSSLNVRPTLERTQTSFDGKNLQTLNNQSITCEFEPNRNYTLFESNPLKIFGKIRIFILK